MILNAKNIALANKLRQQVIKETATVSDGEGVSFILLWSFLVDHAQCHGLDVDKLAEDQMRGFIDWAMKHLTMRRPN